MKPQENNIVAVYPLTPFQRGMVYRSQVKRQGGEFVVQLTMRLRGNLELETFRASWNQVAARHGALRSCFAWKLVEQPVRVVRQKVGIPMEIFDFKMSPPDRRLARWLALCEDERSREFDLTVAPLMRILVCRVDDNEYRIAWTHHHLILDGWSLPLVMAEVFEIYDALILGEIFRPEAEIAYEEYLDWHRKAKDDPDGRAYWRRVLEGFQGARGIDASRQASGSHVPDYAEIEIQLARKWAHDVDVAARRAGVSSGVVLQAAWASVQLRLSGRDDIMFGALIAGRPPEVESIDVAVGMFVNILPVRVQVDARTDVRTLLGKLNATMAETQAYQFSKTGDYRSGTERAADERYFDVVFVYENYPGNDLAATSSAGLELDEVQVRELGDAPMTLIVTPQDGFRVQLIYDRAIYDDGLANSVLSAFSCALGGLVGNSALVIRELPLLGEQEREALLGGVNATTREVDGRTLVERFEEQVERHAGHAALEYEGQTLSYAELNARANRLGCYLKGLGVRPEVRVGVCLERSLELVVGLLGVLKAGGAYVPLDPLYPKVRLAAMLEDAKPDVVIMQASLREALPTHPGCTVSLDGERDAIAGCEATNLDTVLHPDNAVYCLYTSGSTGLPKGVVGTYRALANRFAWMERAYPGPKPQRVVHRSPLNFVDSVAEIFAPLTLGDCVVIWSAPQVADAAGQLARVDAERINFLMSVPSILSVALDSEATACASFQELRTVGVGGEPTSAQLCRRFQSLLPDVRLLHLYGATETAADVMVYEPAIDSQVQGNAPIGRPIDNMQVYILDAWFELVPVGVVGEIYLGGLGLARGYLNRPDLTAERFVPNPFGPQGSRLYRTGDLGRWLDDATVDCQGRADQQVKVRGHRIELGEIEEVSMSHPGVKDAVVVMRAYGEDDRRLVAYVVRQSGAVLSIEGVRRWVGDKLPGYMVPAVWEWMEALPLTPNGKIDRKALPAPGEQLEHSAAYDAPRNETERLLVEVWEKVLKVKGVGVNQNFFDAGGDSMLLLRVHAELAKHGKMGVSVVDLMRYPTIQSLSMLLASDEQSNRQTHADSAGPM